MIVSHPARRSSHSSNLVVHRSLFLSLGFHVSCFGIDVDRARAEIGAR